MIPLRDTNPRRGGFPIVNVGIIVANVLMFFCAGVRVSEETGTRSVPAVRVATTRSSSRAA